MSEPQPSPEPVPPEAENEAGKTEETPEVTDEQSAVSQEQRPAPNEEDYPESIKRDLVEGSKAQHERDLEVERIERELAASQTIDDVKRFLTELNEKNELIEGGKIDDKGVSRTVYRKPSQIIADIVAAEQAFETVLKQLNSEDQQENLLSTFLEATAQITKITSKFDIREKVATELFSKINTSNNVERMITTSKWNPQTLLQFFKFLYFVDAEGYLASDEKNAAIFVYLEEVVNIGSDLNKSRTDVWEKINKLPLDMAIRPRIEKYYTEIRTNALLKELEDSTDILNQHAILKELSNYPDFKIDDINRHDIKTDYDPLKIKQDIDDVLRAQQNGHYADVLDLIPKITTLYNIQANLRKATVETWGAREKLTSFFQKYVLGAFNALNRSKLD